MPKRVENNVQRGGKTLNVAMSLILAFLVVVLGVLIYKNAIAEVLVADDIKAAIEKEIKTLTSDHPAEETPNKPPEPAEEEFIFEPHAVLGTEPENYITLTEIAVDGEKTEKYSPKTQISFGDPAGYAVIPGITTFRGNNYRDGGSWGVAAMTEKKFGGTWTISTASLQAPDGAIWTGNGWTGQPLIASWPPETRRNMTNMYNWAREKENLTEVIYPAMDGYIYFAELSTGNQTRDRLYIGYTFKGAGSLDPRGYPMLYVGAGYDSNRGGSRAFVISLLDGSVLYEFGMGDSFALRYWDMFDSSPLLDAKTDKLIYPGENGILYIIRLNTAYDEEAGTLSIAPSEIVKWRYKGVRTGSTYWLGFESSASILQGHAILADNGGNLMCLDLNTLTLNWAQDVLDDTNSSPVVEVEDGHPYVYISTSYHMGWRSWNSTEDIPIWKIDAVTGEIVWHTDYDCYTVQGVSGGVQGTIAVGKNNVSDLIFVPVARVGSTASAGKLVALRKDTGEVAWERETQMYSWSSPTLVYDQNDRGYLVFCTSGYYIYLIDAETGEIMDAMNIGGNIEATPAVYENTIVVGTRAQQIWGITLK